MELDGGGEENLSNFVVEGDCSRHDVGAQASHDVREPVLNVGKVLTQDGRVDHVQRLYVRKTMTEKKKNCILIST